MPLALVPSRAQGPPDPASWGYRVGAAGLAWVKLLYPDHTRADALWCRDRGMRVLVRAPGEGQVQDADFGRMLTEFAGVAEVFEIGNKPPAAGLWDHLWYIENILTRFTAPCHAAGIRLCSPGWQGATLPPTGALGDRLRAAYARCDLLGVHCYDPWQLTGGQPPAHLAAWRAWLPDRPIHITEAGIAAIWLLPGQPRAAQDLEKARRYAAFLHSLPPWVEAAFLFLLGGTADWFAFNAEGYDPNGGNSYILSDAAWALLGRSV